MNTIHYLLKQELKRPSLWLLGLGAAVAIYGLSLPGPWGVISFILASATLSLFPVALLIRTPWCSDTAFWRTRPISRGELFVVKTLAMGLLGFLPLLVVTWWASADLDRSTQLVVRCWAFGWAGALLLAVSAAVAIGSVKPKFSAISWQAVFTVPLLTAALIAMLRKWMLFPTPGNPAEMISGLMIGAGVVGLMAVAAWLVVGVRGKAQASMAVLFAGGVIWPWIALTNQRDFFLMAEPAERVLTIEDGESSWLKMPGSLKDLGDEEFFVPRDIWWQGRHLGAVREAGIYHMVGREERVTPLTNQHAEFVSVVDAGKIWDHLRKEVPEHEAWVPSENPNAGRPTSFKMPDLEKTEGPLQMWGFVYGIEAMESFAPAGRESHALRDGIEFIGSGVPNGHAIDVRLRVTAAIVGREGSRRRLDAAGPPELWGILLHRESGTAYGTVSIRERRFPDGIGGMLLWRQDLLLRFELPGLESALLGLDPEKILAESELHLFEMTKRGEASASWSGGN